MAAWGGYSNGRIPITVLTLTLGRLLHPAAALSFAAMRLACFAATGIWLGLSDGYRTFATQDDVFRHRYTPGWPSGLAYAGQLWRKRAGYDPAAVPGKSNHGWALAVDLTGWQHAIVWQWLLDHAAAFGWSWTEGRNAGERWHWVYVGRLTWAGGPITPLPVEEPLEEDEVKTIFWQATANSDSARIIKGRFKHGTTDVEVEGIYAQETPGGPLRQLTRVEWEGIVAIKDDVGRTQSVHGNAIEQIAAQHGMTGEPSFPIRE